MELNALIGPALPPMFKKKEDDEDSEDETTCKYERNIDCYRRHSIVIIFPLYISLFLVFLCNSLWSCFASGL